MEEIRIMKHAEHPEDQSLNETFDDISTRNYNEGVSVGVNAGLFVGVIASGTVLLCELLIRFTHL